MNSHKTFLKILLVILSTVGFSSCAPYLRYMRNSGVTENDTINYVKKIPEKYKLQPGDILSVDIYTYNSEINELINIVNPKAGNGYQNSNGNSMYYTGYMLDDQGDIHLPILGKVNLDGKTIPECRSIIQKAAEEFFVSPVVVIKSNGINIACMGEFKGEGIISIPYEQIDIYDAVSYAGGLTEYANKKKIKIIRNEKDRYCEYIVDLTKPETLSSKKFFVKNHDKIIADPIRSKILRRNIQEFTFFLSVVTSTITTTILIINLRRKN